MTVSGRHRHRRKHATPVVSHQGPRSRWPFLHTAELERKLTSSGMLPATPSKTPVHGSSLDEAIPPVASSASWSLLKPSRPGRPRPGMTERGPSCRMLPGQSPSHLLVPAAPAWSACSTWSTPKLPDFWLGGYSEAQLDLSRSDLPASISVQSGSQSLGPHSLDGDASGRASRRDRRLPLGSGSLARSERTCVIIDMGFHTLPTQSLVGDELR
jgi:hypothetical protein